MRIVFISDTHGAIPGDIPEGDVLVHCGDACAQGRDIDVIYFNMDLEGLGFEKVLYVPGNHDWPFQNNYHLSIHQMSNAEVLIDGEIVIDGIKFYGSPWQPRFGNWAFNEDYEQLVRRWSMIPEDVDVLVTHTPPWGILDETIGGDRVGCRALRERLKVIRPKVHAFGHIHESWGFLEKDGTIYINAALRDENYKFVRRGWVYDL